MPANRNSPWTRRLIIGAGLSLCILTAWWFAGGRTIATRAVLRARLAPLIEIMNQPDIPGEDLKRAYFRVHSELVQHLLANPDEVEAALKYLRVSPLDSRDALANGLAEPLYWVFLGQDNRDGLVELLSFMPFYKDCPDGMLIEFSLVEPYSPRPVSNILILFDAYDRATAPGIKESLIDAIRRAFHDRIKPGETDAEVVRRMRREFECDADHLQVNKQWIYVSESQFSTTNYTVPPLFIDRNGPDEVKGSISP